jgi:hypothetical protein
VLPGQTLTFSTADLFNEHDTVIQELKRQRSQIVRKVTLQTSNLCDQPHQVYNAFLANMYQVFEQGLFDQPNLEILQIEGDCDVCFFLGVKGARRVVEDAEKFLRMPHLAFFSSLRELEITGQVCGISRDDDLFVSYMIPLMPKLEILRLGRKASGSIRIGVFKNPHLKFLEVLDPVQGKILPPFTVQKNKEGSWAFVNPELAMPDYHLQQLKKLNDEVEKKKRDEGKEEQDLTEVFI